jgi:glycerol-3-phosphate dehydrogenase
LPLHGYHTDAAAFGELAAYGADAVEIGVLLDAHPDLAERLHPALPYRAAEVIWAARAEMARTLADVLARRTRALFLNAAAAIEMAPLVASLLRNELGRDEDWELEQVREFNELARLYLPTGA